MLTMNRATVLGHAGRNPEIRTLPSGDEVALFSLATNERFRRRDGTEGESTEWHAIVAFGNAAQTVRKLVHRGAAVLVEGRIATRTWTDRSGTEHRTSEILVSGPQARVNVLTKRHREPDGGAAAGAASAEPGQTGTIAAADADAGKPGLPSAANTDAPATDPSDEKAAPDSAAAEPGKAATPGAVSDAGGTHGAKAAQDGAACGDASASVGDAGEADGTSAGSAMDDAQAEEARIGAADDAGSASAGDLAGREDHRGAATGSAAVAAGEANDGHA